MKKTQVVSPPHPQVPAEPTRHKEIPVFIESKRLQTGKAGFIKKVTRPSERPEGLLEGRERRE